MRTLRVPGNILLFGEYAVLEEGGLGIAAAVAPYAYARLSDRDAFLLRTLYGTVEKERHAADLGSIRAESDFLCRILHCCRSHLLERYGIDIGTMTGELVIDTREFYDGDRKLGFGSSAAAAVAAVAAVACHAGAARVPAAGGSPVGTEGARTTGSAPPAAGASAVGRRSDSGGSPVTDGPENAAGTPSKAASAGESAPADLAELVLRCYREVHGGSGYDVLASVNGGVGLFVGGTSPEWQAIPRAWIPPIAVVRGEAPVSTSNAVYNYRRWARANPTHAEHFLASSNRLVRRIARCRSWSEVQPPAQEAAGLYRRLGTQIGVPAEPAAPPASARRNGPPPLAKCSGAGDELTLLFGASGAADAAGSGEDRAAGEDRVAGAAGTSDSTDEAGGADRGGSAGAAERRTFASRQSPRPLELDWEGPAWIE